MAGNRRTRVLVIGFPITDLTGDPFDTFYGIRVRDWALFIMLPGHDIDTYLYIEPLATVSPEIQAAYGPRLVRGMEAAQALIQVGEINMVIASATKYHEFWRVRSEFFKGLTVPVFGAFCYDNDPSALDSDFENELIGVSFTSHDHKLNWEKRKNDVSAITITTGQPAPDLPVTESDGSVIFIGYVHNAGYINKMVNMAKLDPDRSYILVSSFIRDHSLPGKQYHKLPNMTPEERSALIDKLIREHTDDIPANFEYRFLPPGEDKALLQKAAIGLDFSWLAEQAIENSKICRYLTYGIFPISQLPATSSRFVARFQYGSVVRFAASPEEWVAAIRENDKVSGLEHRRRVVAEAIETFAWKNVTAEIADYLHAKERAMLTDEA